MCVVVLIVVFLSLFQSCQADLVKDNGHKYFLSVLADPYMPVRTSHIYSDYLAFACLVFAGVLLLGASPCSGTQCCAGQSPSAELCDTAAAQPRLYNSFGVLKAVSEGGSWGSRMAAGAGNCPTALAIPSAAAGFP